MVGMVPVLQAHHFTGAFISSAFNPKFVFPDNFVHEGYFTQIREGFNKKKHFLYGIFHNAGEGSTPFP